MKTLQMRVDPRSLASPSTCEKVIEFLNRHGLSSMVVEHPEILKITNPDLFKELSRLVDFTWVWVNIGD